MHIVHLVGTLERGGAELFLQRLCRQLGTVEPTWTQSVWTLGSRGALADDIEAAGTEVRAFHIHKHPRALLQLKALIAALRSSNASLLQTWMYHADAVGVAARICGMRAPQVWTLRQSNLSSSVNTASTLAIIRLCAMASGSVPAAIVAGSHAARTAHQAVGYRTADMPVVHNGVDTSRFAPHPERRAAIRRQWGVSDDTLVFGYLARVSPVKAHDVLLAAAATLTSLAPSGRQWRLALIGHGATMSDPSFNALVTTLGLEDYVIAPGPHGRPEEVLPGFDVAVSSSLGEGFPNGVAEAMAAGLPVIATDVGDTAQLVGTTGVVVPPADVTAFGRALAEALGTDRAALSHAGRAARERAEQHFRELDAVRAYADLYRRLARG